ncbi:acyl-CoA synthetase [Streptomyces sp. Ac-502]|uniref:acyl-CoA synthetase n=1 Tax=Streptomyces sp. Ac-502 TaxID=3342801 RepID=UPI003862CC53
MYLTQGLHRALQQTPGSPLTVYEGRVTTAARCADRTARLAAGMEALGVRPGFRVALLSLNSDRFHETLLATWWLGAAIVPLNTRWSAAEVEFALRHSGACVLFVDDACAVLASELKGGKIAVVYCGDGIAPEGALFYEEMLEPTPINDSGTGGDAPAGIFYTGGTTGFPKGVVLSHTNLVSSALGSQATLPLVTPGGSCLHAAPMFHLAALALWTAQLLVGGTHVILPAFTPQGVLRAVERHRVDSALLVPTMLQRLLEHPQRPHTDLSSLRRLVYGGSPIPESTLAEARAALPGVDLVQAYGMTELAPIATLLGPADHQRPDTARSCGRAAAHTQVRILAADGAEAARGQVGEVAVRGANVMLGYWNDPQQTSHAVREGWMHTGDSGWMDEHGYVTIVDRIKDMIISGGENVYSTEVENALLHHPAVAGCAVIGVPDATWGERVHAVVVLAGEGQTTADGLRAHCKELIAGYKCPKTVEFVSELPISPAGKVLKEHLRKARRPTDTGSHE